MKRDFLAVLCGFLIFVSAAAPAAEVDRTRLPPPTPKFKGKSGVTYKDSTPDWTPA